MKMYLCLAIVLLLASAIAGSPLDKTETARNWRPKEKYEQQCDECMCSNLNVGICIIQSNICSGPCESGCDDNQCKCNYFKDGICTSKSACNDTVC
nr:conotoxin precursor Ggeo03 [Conus ebraeus]